MEVKYFSFIGDIFGFIFPLIIFFVIANTIKSASEAQRKTQKGPRGNVWQDPTMQPNRNAGTTPGRSTATRQEPWNDLGKMIQGYIFEEPETAKPMQRNTSRNQPSMKESQTVMRDQMKAERDLRYEGDKYTGASSPKNQGTNTMRDGQTVLREQMKKERDKRYAGDQDKTRVASSAPTDGKPQAAFDTYIPPRSDSFIAGMGNSFLNYADQFLRAGDSYLNYKPGGLYGFSSKSYEEALKKTDAMKAKESAAAKL
jgi:hypothetical protein